MGAATGLIVTGFNHVVHKMEAPEAVESSESGDCLTCPDPTNYSEGAIYEHWFDSSMYKLVDGVWVECPTCKPVVRVVGGAGSLEVIGGAGKGIIKGIDWGIKAVKGLVTAEKTIKVGAEAYKITATVAKNIASRPYINSPSLIKSIIETGKGVADATYKGGINYKVAGTFNGSSGIYELGINLETNTIYHFLFRSIK